MNVDLVRSLDVPGLRRVLPPIVGDEDLASVAEVFRCAVVANVVRLACLTAESPSTGDETVVLRAYLERMAWLLRAPTDAAWWIEHAPITCSALVAAMERNERKGVEAR